MNKVWVKMSTYKARNGLWLTFSFFFWKIEFSVSVSGFPLWNYVIQQFLLGIKIGLYDNWQRLLLKSVHGLPENHQRMYVGLWINELVVFERPVFISSLAFHSVSFSALSCSWVHSSCDIGPEVFETRKQPIKIIICL